MIGLGMLLSRQLGRNKHTSLLLTSSRCNNSSHFTKSGNRCFSSSFFPFRVDLPQGNQGSHGCRIAGRAQWGEGLLGKRIGGRNWARTTCKKAFTCTCQRDYHSGGGAVFYDSDSNPVWGKVKREMGETWMVQGQRGIHSYGYLEGMEVGAGQGNVDDWTKLDLGKWLSSKPPLTNAQIELLAQLKMRELRYCFDMFLEFFGEDLRKSGVRRNSRKGELLEVIAKGLEKEASIPKRIEFMNHVASLVQAQSVFTKAKKTKVERVSRERFHWTEENKKILLELAQSTTAETPKKTIDWLKVRKGIDAQVIIPRTMETGKPVALPTVKALKEMYFALLRIDIISTKSGVEVAEESDGRKNGKRNGRSGSGKGKRKKSNTKMTTDTFGSIFNSNSAIAAKEKP